MKLSLESTTTSRGRRRYYHRSGRKFLKVFFIILALGFLQWGEEIIVALACFFSIWVMRLAYKNISSGSERSLLEKIQEVYEECLRNYWLILVLMSSFSRFFYNDYNVSNVNMLVGGVQYDIF